MKKKKAVVHRQHVIPPLTIGAIPPCHRSKAPLARASRYERNIAYVRNSLLKLRAFLVEHIQSRPQPAWYDGPFLLFVYGRGAFLFCMFL